MELAEVTLSQRRIEALADGVFAVVMTLLVLDLHVPELARHASDAEILDGLRSVLPPLGSFVISFALAAAFWFCHHLSHHFIATINGKLLGINLLFLFFVCLLPFTTSMLGSFSLDATTPIVLYFANIFVLGAILLVHDAYARRHGFQVDDREQLGAIVQLRMRIAGLTIGALAGGTTAVFLGAQWSTLAFIACVVITRVRSRR